MVPESASVLKALQVIPGVGPSIAKDLWALDIRAVADLKNAEPEALYERLCVQRATRIDRCVLYVFRCAVYFANTPNPDPALLKWWVWKD